MESRIIGIDLGVAHTACVVDGCTGEVVCKRQARPTLESLSALESAAFRVRRRRPSSRW
jgi:transposase